MNENDVVAVDADRSKFDNDYLCVRLASGRTRMPIPHNVRHLLRCPRVVILSTITQVMVLTEDATIV